MSLRRGSLEMFPGLNSSLPMIADAPISGKDYLTFSRYVKPFSDMIFDPLTETPFTVGIFGKWGSGKTTLMQFIDATAAEKKYPTIWFNPWLYQTEDNLIVPLLHTIHDWLLQSNMEKAKEAAILVANVIAKIAGSLLVKHLTMDKVSFEDVEKRVKEYVDKRGAAISALRTLRNELQKVVDGLTDNGKDGRRVILFVDDLDRCVPTKIVELLESIKLFLDLKNVILFLAIDRDVVQQGIRHFYKDFKLEEGSQLSALTADYIDKMIQLPFFLYPLGADQVGEYLNQLSNAPDLQEQSELFRNCLLPNPRKIKRVLNVYRLSLAVAPHLFADPDGKRKRSLLAKIVMIQHQWGDLYTDIAANVDLAPVLERIYKKDLDLSSAPNWAEFRDRQEVLMKLSQTHYRPVPQLAQLFGRDPSFVNQDLGSYLHLLG